MPPRPSLPQRIVFWLILLPENCSKNSIFNWVSKLNVDHQTFLHTRKILVLQYVFQIRLSLSLRNQPEHHHVLKIAIDIHEFSICTELRLSLQRILFIKNVKFFVSLYVYQTAYTKMLGILSRFYKNATISGSHKILIKSWFFKISVILI